MKRKRIDILPSNMVIMLVTALVWVAIYLIFIRDETAATPTPTPEGTNQLGTLQIPSGGMNDLPNHQYVSPTG